MIKPIPFSRANIGNEEIKAVTAVLKSGWLTMGEETKKFEEEFAHYIGAKYATSVNSATSALFLTLKALDIKKGDEVIVPSFTFAASVNVIIHVGATPVLVDIKKDDFTIDQKSFEKALSKKTKAVIIVHYGGNRAFIKTKIPVIEDSAHFIPKKGDSQKSFARCYSFYATKNMTTGEGGMITVGSKKIADWLKQARLHGLSRDAWKRYDVRSKWTYSIDFPGYKLNTTDLNSAIGRVQLKRLDKFEKRRREIISLYNKLLGLNNNGTHLYPILVEKRDKFFEYMKKHGVGCSFHFTPLHLEKAYKSYPKMDLKVTEYVGKRVVTLPLDTVITNSEIRLIANLVKKYLGYSASQ